MGTNPSSIKSINKAIVGTVNRGNSPAGQRATNPVSKTGKPSNSRGANTGAYQGADRSQPVARSRNRGA